jgi:hypothetical protein
MRKNNMEEIKKKAKKRKAKKQEPMIEIARSFSYKMGLPNYSSADFFCSQKAQCLPKDAEKTSEAVYQFCKSEVAKAVSAFKREQDRKLNAGARAKENKGVALDNAQFDAGQVDFGEPEITYAEGQS